MKITGVLVDEIPEHCDDCIIHKKCRTIKKFLSKGEKCPLILKSEFAEELVPNIPKLSCDIIVNVLRGWVNDTVSEVKHENESYSEN